MFRAKELLNGDSIAIIDEGLAFGGGNLGQYGVNSNTSAHGFLKCTSRKTKSDEKIQNDDSIDEVLVPFRELSNSGIG